MEISQFQIVVSQFQRAVDDFETGLLAREHLDRQFRALKVAAIAAIRVAPTDAAKVRASLADATNRMRLIQRRSTGDSDDAEWSQIQAALATIRAASARLREMTDEQLAEAERESFVIERLLAESRFSPEHAKEISTTVDGFQMALSILRIARALEGGRSQSQSEDSSSAQSRYQPEDYASQSDLQPDVVMARMAGMFAALIGPGIISITFVYAGWLLFKNML